MALDKGSLILKILPDLYLTSLKSDIRVYKIRNLKNKTNPDLP